MTETREALTALIRRFEVCPLAMWDDRPDVIVVRDAARDCWRLSRFPSGIVPGMDSLDWRVLVLRNGGDVYRAIGEQLGMSTERARRRHLRARRQLLDYLSRHGSWVSECNAPDDDACFGRDGD